MTHRGTDVQHPGRAGDPDDSGSRRDGRANAAADADAAALSPLREIARSGLLAVLLHPLASAVTVACLIAMLAPFLVGLGISRGVTEETAASIDLGPDLHVAGSRYGRPAPLPLSVAAVLARVPGVTSVEPRIVGATSLGVERVPVVVVGVADERLAAGDGSGVTLVAGRLPAPGGAAEVAIGSDLAQRLGLVPGSMIPPFYRNERGERATLVTGVFRSDLPAWQGRILLAPYSFAASIFDERDTATGFLVRCPPAYRAAARVAIQRLPPIAPAADEHGPALVLRVVTKDELAVLLERRAHGREGGLALLWALVFSVGVPLVLASTGLGLSERRSETALLRAIGWRTDEVLLRSLCESLALAVAGAALSLLTAWVWVRGFRGAGIAQVFQPDGGPLPDHDIPFRLAPEALLSAIVVALVVTTAGSLWSSWRAASAPPTEALR